MPIHNQLSLVAGHWPLVSAVCRIVFQQIRKVIDIPEIVDGDNLDPLMAERLPKEYPPDAAEAVDGHSNIFHRGELNL